MTRPCNTKNRVPLPDGSNSNGRNRSRSYSKVIIAVIIVRIGTVREGEVEGRILIIAMKMNHAEYLHNENYSKTEKNYPRIY